MSAPRVHRDLRPLVEAAEAAQWTCEHTKKGHLRLTPPEGWRNLQGEPQRPLILPGTPSDHRSMKNARADLRRAGVKV